MSVSGDSETGLRSQDAPQHEAQLYEIGRRNPRGHVEREPPLVTEPMVFEVAPRVVGMRGAHD